MGAFPTGSISSLLLLPLFCGIYTRFRRYRYVYRLLSVLGPLPDTVSPFSRTPTARSTVVSHSQAHRQSDGSMESLMRRPERPLTSQKRLQTPRQPPRCLRHVTGADCSLIAGCFIFHNMLDFLIGSSYLRFRLVNGKVQYCCLRWVFAFRYTSGPFKPKEDPLLRLELVSQV